MDKVIIIMGEKMLSTDDFDKADMRVGTIVEVGLNKSLLQIKVIY